MLSIKKIDRINYNQKLFLNNGIDYLIKANPSYDGILIIDTLFDSWGEQEMHSIQAHKPVFSQETTRRDVQVAEPSIDTVRKKSFFDRFKPAPKTAENIIPTDKITRDFDNLSKGINRVICVTGHRGSGLTSTSVNIAYEASKRGLSAILIDMDIQYRGCNAYFDSFHSSTKKDEEMNASLIRTLARPQDYKTTCFNVANNLWLTSLGYSFNDKMSLFLRMYAKF